MPVTSARDLIVPLPVIAIPTIDLTVRRIHTFTAPHAHTSSYTFTQASRDGEVSAGVFLTQSLSSCVPGPCHAIRSHVSVLCSFAWRCGYLIVTSFRVTRPHLRSSSLSVHHFIVCPFPFHDLSRQLSTVFSPLCGCVSYERLLVTC